MAFVSSLVSLAFLAALVALSQAQTRKRFEYKYSFKGPHLARDNGEVFYWKVSGNTIASSDQVRLTASMRSQKGQMSTKAATDFKYWQVDMAFRITGRARVGADGLAFWLTKDPIVEGPVFGAGDYWNGLGIFLDSFDNDGKTNNPYVLAISNNGSISYDHTSDGYNQMLAGCLRDFRNRAKHVRARIKYYENILEVYFNTIFDQQDDAYELCLRATNVDLPPSGHFGLSAATGGLADDHDVMSFLVYSLDKPQGVNAAKEGDGGVEGKKDEDEVIFEADELEKLQKEFEQYNKAYEEKHDSYVKDHPDPYADVEGIDSYEDRTLSEVMKGQADILSVIRDLAMKFERLSLSSSPPSEDKSASSPSAEQYRIIADNQNRIMQQLETIKATANQRQGSQGGSYEHGPAMIEMEKATSRLESLIERFEVNQREKRAESHEERSSPPSSCIPMHYFGLFVVSQIVFIVAFVAYRWKAEASAKKLF